MGLIERFLRWYTGRQIPQAAARQSGITRGRQRGWYPPEPGIALASFPIQSGAEIEEAQKAVRDYQRQMPSAARELRKAIARMQEANEAALVVSEAFLVRGLQGDSQRIRVLLPAP